MAVNRHVTEPVKLKRRVLTEVARLAWQGKLAEEIDDLPEKLLSMGKERYRCCEFKEKAIYAERIKLALGLGQKEEYKKKRLSELLPKALEFPDLADNQVNVINVACEGCPINKFFVTNACQNCLAHPCRNSCPRDAISVVQNQAYIDQNRCLECGMCKRSCPYGAIIEINRPCEASCQIGAIKANTDRKATIDLEKCVECGTCMVGCPYGAISDKSQIVKVIEFLKTEKVYAIIAPSFIGQLGQKENPGPFLKAMELLGFTKVVEAALGADIVALEESEEFIHKVPKELDFMTSSCCPGFVNLVDKHFPDLKKHVSSTVSPMVAVAKYLKQEDREGKIVFIGPCVAKKTEAYASGVIDATLTFEELTALLVAKDINVSELEATQELSEDISRSGRGFAEAGGVKAALNGIMEKSELTWKPVNAQGLKECSQQLKELIRGKSEYNFLEGMACQGGCVGGPGAVVDGKFTGRFLQKLCQKTVREKATDNTVAQEIRKKLGTDLHR